MHFNNYTGATPKASQLSYIWNLKDSQGNTVPDGIYYLLIEGSLCWDNRVIYSTDIEVGDDIVVGEIIHTFIYGTGDYANALTEDAPERSMITNVKVSSVDD